MKKFFELVKEECGKKVKTFEILEGVFSVGFLVATGLSFVLELAEKKGGKK